jgi:zinc protease
MGCALDELYGLGFAYGDQEDARIEAVTLEATRDAAKRFLTPDRHVLVVVKPGTE